MIAFIAYVSAVSLLLVAAATASEPLLRATRQPTRGVWLAAVFGGVVIALVPLLAPHPVGRSLTSEANADAARTTGTTSSTARPAREVQVLERRSNDAIVRGQGTTPTARETAAASPDATLLAAGCWLVASFGCLAWLVAGTRQIGRVRRSCHAGRLCGERVLVSDRAGPAVLGVFRQLIVIPAWVEQLDEDAQRLILAHEREHVRARDPLALHAVMLLVALMPWNIAFWFALHRLRAALEIDCDARVLRGERSTTREYCRLLLEVGERTVGSASPLLALAEPATLLERRIESMTTSHKLLDWETLVPAAGALMLIGGAWRAPRPEIGPVEWPGAMARARSSAIAIARGPETAFLEVAPVSPAVQPPPHEAGKLPSAPSSLTPTRSSRTAIVPLLSATVLAGAQEPDTTVRNEEALRRSAAEHQARIDAIADSVIVASYPELTRRPPGTPAFLALVLDDRKRVMRHAISLDSVLPNDLAAIMLALRVDTISARTIGLGISDDNRWNVTVGHAVEALGPARGRTEMRASMTAARPYALWRVPYTRIVDSVARARNPEADEEHEGTFAIAMILDETGQLVRYAAEPHHQVESETSAALMKRLLGDSASAAADIVGVNVHLRPSKTVLVWRVRH